MFTKIKGHFFANLTDAIEDRWIFGVILVTGLISLLASFVLSVEVLTIAKDSDAVLSCDLNAVISCGSVMRSDAAYLFGIIPNSFLGMMAESVVVTIAVAGLARVKFPRWFMFCAQLAFVVGGLVFAYWMFYESMFVIGALCPWCLSVTTSTTVMVAALTRYNIRNNNLFLPKHVQQKAEWFIGKNYDVLTAALAVFLLVVAVLLKYGNSLFA